MSEEQDEVEKAVRRGYTNLVFAMVKDYVDECRKANVQPRDVSAMLSYCGFEELAEISLTWKIRK